MNYDQIDSDSCFWHITSSCIYRSDCLVCPGIKGKNGKQTKPPDNCCEKEI